MYIHFIDLMLIQLWDGKGYLHGRSYQTGSKIFANLRKCVFIIEIDRHKNKWLERKYIFRQSYTPQ